MLHWVKSYGDSGERGIIPRGGVASGRVCACSLRLRLVLLASTLSWTQTKIKFMSVHDKNSCFPISLFCNPISPIDKPGVAPAVLQTLAKVGNGLGQTTTFHRHLNY